MPTSSLGRDRVANDRERLLSNLLARCNVIRREVIARIDLLGGHETIQFNSSIVLNPRRRFWWACNWHLTTLWELNEGRRLSFRQLVLAF
jgi:hypothetical protein